MSRRTKIVLGAMIGFVSTFATVYWYAWAASLVTPADWIEVLSLALSLAPFGAVIGGFMGGIPE